MSESEKAFREWYHDKFCIDEYNCMYAGLLFGSDFGTCWQAAMEYATKVAEAEATYDKVWAAVEDECDGNSSDAFWHGARIARDLIAEKLKEG